MNAQGGIRAVIELPSEGGKLPLVDVAHTFENPKYSEYGGPTVVELC